MSECTGADSSHARLRGRVAIVTGAAGGMGAAFVRALIAARAAAAATDLRVAEGRRLAREAGARCRFLEHDVRDSASWERVVAATERAFGPISVLVNNAGVARAGSAESMSEEEFRGVTDVNQLGVFLGIRAVAPSMRRAGRGSIVNISSIAAMVAWSENIAYIASKWAVRGITKAAALDLAPAGIRVNAVLPGIIDTAMSCSVADADPMVTGMPLARKGRPDELANLVVFLASDDSSYCTGAEFVADGGYSAR